MVFLGLFIINISFLTYQTDMDRYVKGQVFLKALAEECAAGAALYYDAEEYSHGRLVFNYEEGEKYIKYIIDSTRSKSPFLQLGKLSYQTEFQDDDLGYKDGEGHNLSYEKGVPSLTVTLTYDIPDMFRLPFIEVTQITRMSRYELPEV